MAWDEFPAHAYAFGSGSQRYEIVICSGRLWARLCPVTDYPRTNGYESDSDHIDLFIYAAVLAEPLSDLRAFAFSASGPTAWMVRAPLWSVLGVASSPLLLWLGARWHGWRGTKPGMCRACGYDLRGSEGKSCPECGAERATRLSTPAEGAVE
jgi:hypothetical protein